MEKGVLDDNYFPQEDKFQDNIDIMDRWTGMFGEGLLIGFLTLVVSGLANLASIYEVREDGLLHQNVLIFLLFVVLNKDFLNGQSFIKYYYGYQIIDVKTRKPASTTQCVVRNFTLFFNWIIVIVATIFPKRRVGDLIAGTKLVRVKREKSFKVYVLKVIKNKWNFNFWFSLFLAGFYSWVMVGGGFDFLKKVMQ